MTATEPRISIVGEAWGEQEDYLKFPLVGPTGMQLITGLEIANILQLTTNEKHYVKRYWETRQPDYLKEIWVGHPELHLTNVFNLRPTPTNDVYNLCGKKPEGITDRIPLAKGKYVRKEYEPELRRLYAELEEVDSDLILALGNTAVWALLGRTGIRKWRGAPSVGYAGRKVLPTYHPSAINRQYNLFPIFIADLQKARKESFFREIRRPERFIHYEPTFDDLLAFERDYIIPSPDLSIDVETAANQITEIGFAPTANRCIVVPFLDDTKPDKNYWPTLEVEQQVWRWVKRMCGLPKARVIGQNFNYDMKFLLASYGIEVPYANHDTMLLHHALQPEMEKSLGFMGSVYTDELAWKFMRTEKGTTVKKED